MQVAATATATLGVVAAATSAEATFIVKEMCCTDNTYHLHSSGSTATRPLSHVITSLPTTTHCSTKEHPPWPISGKSLSEIKNFEYLGRHFSWLPKQQPTQWLETPAATCKHADAVSVAIADADVDLSMHVSILLWRRHNHYDYHHRHHHHRHQLFAIHS